MGDFNNDGLIDVAARVETPYGGTHVYLQGPAGSWTNILLANADMGEGMALLDVNRDGRLDVVESGIRLQQPPDPVNGNWVRHDFAAWPDGAYVALGDINNDGRIDVIMTPEELEVGKISWFEQPVDPVNGTWIEHVILSPVGAVHRIRIADFNKDGTLDVAFAEMSQSPQHRIGMLYNNGGGASWDLQVFATTGGHNIAIGDIGSDGDVDILNADWRSGALEIWRNDLNTGNTAPTVATAAAANPASVAATTTNLSVLGADDGGEANLTYTWATTGAPPAAVTFSANGTNAAKNVVATFTKAGSYTFQVTIRDAGGLTVTSSVSVIVTQTLTSLEVAPPRRRWVSGARSRSVRQRRISLARPW